MEKQEKKGIWTYNSLLPDISVKYRLTLDEGHTPLREINSIYFKCEYENPTGSHKDRAMAFQVSRLFEKGIKKAVISSSGNAAISAASYCQLAGIELTVFVSPKIKAKKLNRLEKLSCQIFSTPKPISSAFRFAQENQAINLKQSADENALFGYMTLAFELIESAADIDAIFIPVSGGAGVCGLIRGYKRAGKKLPAIHVVQTEAVHPLSSIFDKDYIEKETSIADAIVAKYSPLYPEIIENIRESKGFGWVIADSDMVNARKWLLENNLKCSYEGAAALAALWKAKKRGMKYRHPVCILTGKNYEL